MRQAFLYANACSPRQDFAQIHHLMPANSLSDLVLHVNYQQRGRTNFYSRLCYPHPETKTSSDIEVIRNGFVDLPATLHCLADLELDHSYYSHLGHGSTSGTQC
jgi:hypothetical protein